MRIQFIGGPRHGEYLEVMPTRRVIPFIQAELPDGRSTRYLLKSWVGQGSDMADRRQDLERVYAWEKMTDLEFLEMSTAEVRMREDHS